MATSAIKIKFLEKGVHKWAIVIVIGMCIVKLPSVESAFHAN